MRPDRKCGHCVSGENDKSGLVELFHGANYVAGPKAALQVFGNFGASICLTARGLVSRLKAALRNSKCKLGALSIDIGDAMLGKPISHKRLGI